MKNKGFTLLEIVIVLGVVMIIAAMAITSLGRFSKNAALDAARQDIITALHEARELTLSSKDATVYGVHVETDRVVRFTGALFATSTPSNVVYLFDPRVRMVSLTFIGGGSDVIFRRLTGESNKSGAIVVAVYGSDNLRSTTTVSLSGIIQ